VMGEPEPVRALDEVDGLDDKARDLILHGNLSALLEEIRR
jgi:hypothetical protein